MDVDWRRASLHPADTTPIAEQELHGAFSREGMAMSG
jgi:hypothetical protein